MKLHQSANSLCLFSVIWQKELLNEWLNGSGDCYINTIYIYRQLFKWVKKEEVKASNTALCNPTRIKPLQLLHRKLGTLGHKNSRFTKLAFLWVCSWRVKSDIKCFPHLFLLAQDTVFVSYKPEQQFLFTCGKNKQAQISITNTWFTYLI